MEFQERLYELRKRQGLSQEELANIIGVSRQAVQKWEAGTSRPDLDNLISLAQFFDVTLDELVYCPSRQEETEGWEAKAGPQAPDGMSYEAFFWRYEFKSKATLFGLPLVHVYFSRHPMAEARGILAIGNRARGVVALGGLSMGVVSLGGLSIGALALGGGALGGLALGGISAGMMAAGGCAVGLLYAVGGLAIGSVAQGGLAIGEAAIGAKALGKAAFSLGDNGTASPAVWAAFCEAVKDKGPLFRSLARFLSLIG